MRTGRNAEIHKSDGSNGPTSSRPSALVLLRQAETDHRGSPGVFGIDPKKGSHLSLMEDPIDNDAEQKRIAE
jgi:hypothetical protein